jgi:hypothetical protein
MNELEHFIKAHNEYLTPPSAWWEPPVCKLCKEEMSDDEMTSEAQDICNECCADEEEE